MGRRLALVLAVFVTVAVVSGCAESPEQVPATAPSAPSTAPAEAASLRPMKIEEKQLLIAPGFQPEVPVVFGEVVRGQAQGNNAWDYELIVAAPPAAVAAWYQEAYTGRDWQVAEQSVPSPGALTLTLVKNAAETRVAITPEDGGKSRVVGVLGVGAPVLQTQ